MKHQEEVEEMLLQQGLDDIVTGSFSEQVAYLLVERARLLDELEAEQGKGESSAGRLVRSANSLTGAN